MSSSVAKGRFIAIEGIDGSGKSTQAQLLAEKLGGHAIWTHEPGATQLGVSLRSMLLDSPRPKKSDSDFGPSIRTQALLMLADRAQHVAEVIAPALERGLWVISDRYSASTVSYQGSGGGLDQRELAEMSKWASIGVEPDLWILIDVPIEVSKARRTGLDRMEASDPEFFERVRAGYLALARESPTTWFVVDGTASITSQAKLIAEAVSNRLGSITE